MRRTGGAQKPDWVIDEDDKFVGLMLGADFTAEHEHGIKDINRDLGVMATDKADRTKVFGAKRYRVHDVNPNFFLWRERKSTQEAVLVFSEFCDPEKSWLNRRERLDSMNFNKFCADLELGIFKPIRNQKDYEPPTLVAAWDEGSFGIHVKGKEQVERLRRLHQAFLDDDAIVFLGSPSVPVFGRSSLNLIIASQMPEEGSKILEDGDREIWELFRDAEKTGIEKKLLKAGKQFFALSPRRGPMETRVVNNKHAPMPPTKYKIVFFLNPAGFGEYNSGWFTVEELNQWIKGNGPVMKEQEQTT